MKPVLVAFGSGLLFAIGLGIAGMTSPDKVIAFLDVTSPRWDPSLAFVMAGAIGVHVFFARRGAQPERLPVNLPLVLGAATFGIGWGLAGFCPGPALVAFVATPSAVVFVGAMLAGMWGTHIVRNRALREGQSARDHA